MKPHVKAPFTVYGEEQAQELISQIDGRLTVLSGRVVPLTIFLNDVWQSAKREGYIDGYVEARADFYVGVHGHEPPLSLVGDWRKRAAKKALDENSAA